MVERFAGDASVEANLLEAIARGGPLTEIKGLLDAGANPNGQGDGLPLAVAAGQGREDVARVLLAAGASGKAVLATGWDAMMCATGAGRIEMAGFLTGVCDPCHTDGDGGNALLVALACRSRHKDWEELSDALSAWQGVGAVSKRFGGVFEAFLKGCRTTGSSGADVTEERALAVAGMLFERGAAPIGLEAQTAAAGMGWAALVRLLELAALTAATPAGGARRVPKVL